MTPRPLYRWLCPRCGGKASSPSRILAALAGPCQRCRRLEVPR